MAAVIRIPTLVKEMEVENGDGRRGALNDIAPGRHLIAAFSGVSSGPTLIVIGGIHGNETSGVVALSQVAGELEHLEPELKGRVYFVAGNTRALNRGVRFIDADLNRSWTTRNLSPRGSPDFLRTSEGSEVSELIEIIDGILVTAHDEVYVVDLHSTSADGVPFATVGDTMRNRCFAQRFPVTIILGVEEQLDGTLLEYLNNAGAVTLGFEGGQHYSEQTIRNHENIVWQALINSEMIAEATAPADLRQTSRSGRIVEILYRHPVGTDDEFEMLPGFDNFDPVVKGQKLAHDRQGAVRAPESGELLMPLYQKLGEDGFFIGRGVAAFWLYLSAVLRRLRLPDMISILPGVHQDEDDPATLVIDTRIASLFPLQVFHLLGFRKRRWTGDKLIVSRRKHDVLSPFSARGGR